MAPRKTQKSAGIKESNEGHAVTQTEDLRHSDQIEYYKKQINLLQKELETYKNLNLELQSEIKILKEANTNALNKDADKISLNQRYVNSKVRNSKVLTPSPIVKSKGCSCKGNCSSKICGCVKKGNLCQEFCRCSDIQCQNQEVDKENVEQIPLTSDGQKALEKLGSLTLNQETLHASEKKLKRSIFSPHVSKSFHNNEEKNYSASPLVFETRRKLFTQDSDDLVDVNTSEHEKDDLANELDKLESQSIKSPVSKHTDQLKDTEKTLNEQATANVTEPQSMKLKEKKSNHTEKTTKKKENKKQLREPTIIVHNDEENGKDEIFKSDNKSQLRRSPCLLRKSKSISPDCNVVKRKYDKVKAKVKSRSVSPKDCATTKNGKENNLPKLGKVEHNRQSYNSQTINSIKNVENTDNENNNHASSSTNKVKIESSQENVVGNAQSFESNSSGNTSNSSNHIGLIDSSLNPMVPKRQLARSPISTGTVILSIDNKKFSPLPKKELAAEEVDWDQHQSELVQCKKCKRKFFPHRIDTHMKSCKGT